MNTTNIYINTMIIKLLLISIFWVLVLDIAGFGNTINNFAQKIFNESKPVVVKPFSCSLCMSFWASLIYLTFFNILTLENLVLSILFACTTNIIREIWYTINDLVIKILQKIA